MKVEGRPSSVAVAAGGAALFGVCRAIQIFLDAQPTASLVGQALLVEWAAGKLGVVWSPPAAPRSVTGAPGLARRAAIGFGVGLGVAAVLVVVLAITGGAKVSSVARAEPSILVIGLLSAALVAWRDELLIRGLTLRALEETTLPSTARIAACALTSGGAALGASDASARSVLAAMLLGMILGALWLRDRGAWMPFAANTAIRFGGTTLFAGGVLQVRLADAWWGGGPGGMLASGAAVGAFLPLAAAALWVSRRSNESGESREIRPRVG